MPPWGAVEDVWVGRADIVREGFSSVLWYRDTILQSVQRFGKSVVLGFVNEQACRYVVAELGMTGLLLFRSVPTKYPQHVHVRLSFEGCREPELRYWNPRRFGRLSLLDKTGLERYLMRRFGVDPLLVSKQHFVKILRERRGRLKPLLMHQQVIAGIGNIYANEILFRAGFHPNMQVSRLSVQKIERLHTIMREVLEEAILSGGSSIRDFCARRHRGAIQAPPFGVWERGSTLSKSLWTRYPTSPKRAQFVHMSNLSGFPMSERRQV